MSIQTIDRTEITRCIDESRKHISADGYPVRVLFTPTKIHQGNLKQACALYSLIEPGDFDTVIIVESSPSPSEKRLSMPSLADFTTPIGSVPANDRLRNEFCDEDDDFFIDDATWSESMSLYDQLILLQSTLGEFSVVSLQIREEGSFIVRELAAGIEELLTSRGALVIFCCDLPGTYREEFEMVMEYHNSRNQAGLMNYLNGEQSHATGVGALVAGLLLCQQWNLAVEFDISDTDNLCSGVGRMQKVAQYG